MADKDLKIGIQTEADVAPVVEYSEAYKALQEELAKSKERLAELEEQSEDGGFGGLGIAEAKEEVAKLEKALEDEAKAAKKAASETAKLDKATDGAADAAEGHADALAGANVELSRGEALLKEARRRLEERTEAEEESAKASKASAQAEDILKIRRAEQGKAIQTIGDNFGKVGGRLKFLGGEIGKVDEELGGMVTTLGEAAEQTNTVVSAAAQGFAVAGPIGAAVGALSGVIGDLYDTWLEGQKLIADSQAKVIDRNNRIKEGLAEIGKEAARADFSKYVDGLESGLDLLKKQGLQLQLNLRLEKERAGFEREQEDLEREAREGEIRRQLSRGEIGPGEAAVALTQERASEIEEREFRRVEPQRERSEQADRELNDLLKRLAELEAKQRELETEGPRFQEAVGFAQLRVTQLEEAVGGVAQSAEAVDARTRLEGFKEKLKLITDELEETAKAINELGPAIDEARVIQAAEVKSLDQGVEAAKNRIEIGTSELLENTKLDLEKLGTKIFEEVLPKIDEGILEVGVAFSERGKETRGRLKEISEDAIADSKQLGEFLKLLKILREEGVGNTRELIRITKEELGEVKRLKLEIKNLLFSVKQLRGG